jgi:hypothetical protein
LVKPVHPIEGFPLERLDCLPGAFLANNFGLVKAIDGLGQRIVVAVSGAAHRGLDSRLQEPLAVANGDVLRALVAVVNQPALVGFTGAERLLQGIQNKVCLHVATDPPAHDEPRVDIDNKGHIRKPLPSRDKGKVSHPELVGALCGEVAVKMKNESSFGGVGDSNCKSKVNLHLHDSA